MSLIEAKSVVLEIMQHLDSPDSHYWKIWSKVVNVYRTLHLYHSHNVRLNKYVMDNNKIIYYPDDMLELVTCYIPYEGQMVRLTPKKIVPTISRFMGNDIRNEEDGEGEAIAVSTMGYKAKPHNIFGYYYDYKKERYIAFLTEERTEVILAYKTSGLTSDDTLIPEEFKNALIWGVVYQEVLLSKNTMWRTQEVKAMYDEEVRMLRKPTYDVNALLDVWLNGATLNR
jgi:hypothetical protein